MLSTRLSQSSFNILTAVSPLSGLLSILRQENIKMHEATIFRGQTLRDLQTLMHTFFGFPGACCKMNILID